MTKVSNPVSIQLKKKESIVSSEADTEKSSTSTGSNIKDERSFCNDSSDHRNINQRSFYKDFKEIRVA